MMTVVNSWFKENQTLVYFLIVQGIAIITVCASILAYSVRLETRVNTLEVRGSPHLERVDGRLTVLEAATETNKQSIDRIVNVMTRKLNINP